MKSKIIAFVLLVFLFFSSCESEQERKERLAREERQRIEYAERQEKENIEREKRQEEERLERERREEQERIERDKREEQARIERAIREEQERKEREIYNRYINNSLQTGATPYRAYYGGNSSCKEWGCSEIKVRTPNNSDVLVTIKSNNRVVRHAYIRANSSFTFEMPNGTYQPFFYYGKGWNPEKEMKRANDTPILGGFISGESFGKDSPQSLNNNILEYTLILQQNGNFSTQPSNSMEAL